MPGVSTGFLSVRRAIVLIVMIDDLPGSLRRWGPCVCLAEVRVNLEAGGCGGGDDDVR